MALIDLHAADGLLGYVRKSDDGAGASVELLVKGASCAGCINKIERGVGALPGVSLARLNLTTGRLTVRWNGTGYDPAEAVRAVQGLGYSAVPFDPAEMVDSEDREGRRLLMALGVAAFGAGNVMMFSIPVWAGLFDQEMGVGVRTLMYWLSALVAAPCTLFAGVPFFRSAWASVRRGKANMDVPISIGVILTLAISLFETALHGPHAYFDAAIMLVFLLLIGRFLDHHLRSKARGAARDLLALQAPVAVIIDASGQEARAPVSQVRAGDRLAVAPGERIPVDGHVAQGAASLDLSLITGESLSARVGPGDQLYAGSLSLDGRLVMIASAPADRSTVAELARLMEAGSQSKSKFVRLADKAAAIYVPAVHSAAALTFAGWMLAGLGPRESLLRAVAVLIITCPCALGLAAPAVQITAAGRLFRRGVLVKSGAALERLAQVTHVIFDKTGVMTTGAPVLEDAPVSAITIAAPLARASRHPLARALAVAAGPGPAADDAVEQAGLGVEARIDGRLARLGSAAFLGIPTRAGCGSELWFGFEGETRFRFRFIETLRPDAARTVAALEALGLTVELLSGDRPQATERIAREAGIQAWRAAVDPAGKAARVADLQAAGHLVLMVGDGLNDAPALAGAHASMAPGTALDASQNAADMVFSGEGLDAVRLSIEVARAARRRSLENFGFSALYNVVAAPAAMLGLVNPMIAALAMAGSSLAVTLNAMRMTWAGRRS